MNLTPTPEQQAIINAALTRGESLMVSALAGTAKTTTLVMLSKVLPRARVLALAFNKKIAEELTKVLPEHFTVKTMNGLGHGAIVAATGRRPQVDSNKIAKLLKVLKLDDEEWATVRLLVIRARVLGIAPGSHKGLLPDDEDGWAEVFDALDLDYDRRLHMLARDVLIESIKQAKSGLIDYDDQIYHSLFFDGVYQKYDIVLVDEAQDLSPLNHLQVKKSLLPSGRLIVVGDPKQAIYAFRGADSSSMEKLRALREDWIDLPLRLTFRCPKAIVARQQDHAPGYTAAEANPEGEVHSFEEEWKLPQEPSLAILCRNNAPLISMAFKLIRRRISIQMLGRDFGKGLEALLKKTCGEDKHRPAAECREEIDRWLQKECRLLEANKKEHKIPALVDRAESLLAIIESGEDIRTLQDIKQAIQDLFSRDSGKVVLASGHKAKGLEWDTVIHLDPWRIPSRFARGNPMALGQEMNLKYVIETRAKRKLILADLEAFA